METSTAQRTRYDHTQGRRIIGPEDGKLAQLMTIGARMMAWTEETGGGFSLLEHPMPPRALAAPVHKHTREDEYSFVIEGRMGALLGDETLYAEVGDLVFKPRDQWHTFWNAGDEPCRVLEIIAPGGFEHFFDELGDLLKEPDFSPEQLGPLGAKYGVEFQPDSVQGICAEHGLVFPM